MAPPKKNAEKTAKAAKPVAEAKKNAEKTAKAANPEAEVKKKRVCIRKVKPPLKVPTIIKVKIPNPSAVCPPEVSETMTSPVKRNKLIPNEIKVQMANEVLQTVLGKSRTIKVKEEAPKLLQKVPKLTRRRKISENEVTPQPKKRSRRKKLVEPKVTVKDEEVTVKDEEVSPEADLIEDLTPKKNLKQPVKKVVKKVAPKQTAAPKPKKPPAPKPKVKSNTPLGPRTKYVRGKKNASTIPNDQVISNIATEIENNICNSTKAPQTKPVNGDLSDNSRRTSMSSNCLSWTKDISSSSTTTCYTVQSEDFYRIDNKIPILELEKIECEPSCNDSASSSSDSESSSSDPTSTNSENTRRPIEIASTPELNGGQSPNLSTSTYSRAPSYNCSPSAQKNNYKGDEINTFENALIALDKVKVMIKSFNLEILDWIGYSDQNSIIDPKQKFRVKIIDQLRQENDIVKACEQIEEKSNKQVTEPKNYALYNVAKPRDYVEMNTEIMSSTYTDKNIDFSLDPSVANFSNNSSPSKVCSNSTYRDVPARREEYSDEEDYRDEIVYDDRYGYRNKPGYREESSFRDHDDDDDDALSLFAEGSITGAESYRYNSSVASAQFDKEPNEIDEYVPQPVSKEFPTTACYRPSKITDFTSENNMQCNDDNNADKNTENNKVFKIPSNLQKVTNSVQHFNNSAKPITINHSPPEVANNQTKKPVLMASIYRFHNKNQKKRVVFKDVCFFNLVSTCNRENCGFPHVILDTNVVKNAIIKLSEEVFIREYMHLRNWRNLRIKYGMCFVQECARRELTNYLIEMAIDFTMKMNKSSPEEVTLKVAVLETTLLHLNKINLSTCKELLNYNMGQGVLLCDVFMQTIAETQNFSQFKLVFINLTNFISQQNRTFSINVAESILERVTILPCEEPIAKALFTIIENTAKEIFRNPMLSYFEAQLQGLNKELYNRLEILKVQSLMTSNACADLFAVRSPLLQEIEPRQVEQDTRFPPPETSNQNSMNGMVAEEPLLSRPLVDRLPQVFTVTNNYANSPTVTSNYPNSTIASKFNTSVSNIYAVASPSSDSDDNYRQSNERFKKYRDMSFNKPVFEPRIHMRPPSHRGPVKRRFDQRQITFRSTLPKFPRRF